MADIDDLDIDDLDIDGLLRLLAAELDTVVGDIIRHRSPDPARLFAARVRDTDLAVPTGDGWALGASAAFYVTVGRLTADRFWTVGDRQAVDRAVSWIHRTLGTECAGSAERAGRLIVPDSDGPPAAVRAVADQLGQDFLPALVWLAAGLVAQDGHQPPPWPRGRHTPTKRL